MNSYVVLGTSTCGYCTAAKDLLESRGLQYQYRDMTELNKEDYETLSDIAGVPFRTVPQIFVQNNQDGTKYIGGFTDLKESLKNG